MGDKSEIKITRTYSLDPVVVSWVTRKAARVTIESDGERASDSKIVNDLLLAAMQKDKRNEAGRKKFIKRIRDYKEMTVAK